MAERGSFPRPPREIALRIFLQRRDCLDVAPRILLLSLPVFTGLASEPPRRIFYGAAWRERGRLVSLRILLADDVPSVREDVKTLLEQAGFARVDEANDGQEALRLSQVLLPDVVILDLSMPGLNGLDAARAIRDVCPSARLIILTAHKEEHQIIRALSLGIGAYVVKSEAPEQLVRAIDEVLHGETFLSPSAFRVIIQPYLPPKPLGQYSRNAADLPLTEPQKAELDRRLE
jgi:DNA-binding NarL/FixJ family response regulator